MVVLVLTVVWRDKNYKRLYYIYYKNDDDTPSILNLLFFVSYTNDDYNTVQRNNNINVGTVFKNV